MAHEVHVQQPLYGICRESVIIVQFVIIFTDSLSVTLDPARSNLQAKQPDNGKPAKHYYYNCQT